MPVYESDRKSIVDKIFSSGIKLSNAKMVIDDRRRNARGTEYFLDYDHTSPLYYREIVERMRKQGYLD